MATPQPRKLGQRAAEALPLADPPPTEVLAPDELARATAWKLTWGAQAWTREPAIDPKSLEDRVLKRFEGTWVPLVELGGRHCYTWLLFLAWRRDHDGLRP